MSLRELIDATPWLDTHEHLVEERRRLGHDRYEFSEVSGQRVAIPADWMALLVDYSICDLVCSGLREADVQRLLSDELSPLEKWDVAAEHIEAARSTGYLRAVDLTTERLCGQQFSRETCEEIDVRLRSLRVPGYYSHVLREIANVSCCQVHTVEDDPFCETHSPDLLPQDLAIAGLAHGRHLAAESQSGIEVATLTDYLRVVDWCFDSYASQAVAVKCNWAYQRPLAVRPPQTPPHREFERLRSAQADLAERRLVEDFIFQRCINLATDAGLPVKIHLGYLDGSHHPQFRHVFDHVRDMTPIVQANPATTFVLMHTAWPQQEQLLALAKHHPNVMLDLCWAWILAPLATREFLTRALTSIPASKLLCFGGDFMTVENVVGHAEIARRGLQATLEGLIGEGWLSHDRAQMLVPLLMHGNAERIFPSRPGMPSTAGASSAAKV
ncbi:MAG: amidohydrolase family protein [Solirubrobacteraceae bacterium]